jgi:uncharacterized protein YndB with AHSA1/START domain
MESRASVIIQRPIDEVFRLTTEHVADWSSIVTEDEVIDDKGGVGTTFRTVTVDRGRRMVFHGIVTEHEPLKLHSVHMVGEQFQMQVKYTFTDKGAEGVRVLQGTRITGKGILAVIFKLFGRFMIKSGCQAAQRELENLKAYCERQA